MDAELQHVNHLMSLMKQVSVSLQYLGVAVEGSVMQGGASAAVRHVDATQHRDDDLGASQRVIGCSDVQRRLPVLVPRVHVGRVADQNSHRLLRKKVEEREFVFTEILVLCLYICVVYVYSHQAEHPGF